MTADADNTADSTPSRELVAMPWLKWAVVVLAVLALLLGAFWGIREVARQEATAAVRSSIGVVDIERALADQRSSYLSMMSRADASDQERAQATAFVKASAQRINTALEVVSDECQCVLLIKPAVLQHQRLGLIDHTARLLELTATSGTAAISPSAQEGRP